ncbi:hypothetical protein GCM10020221_18390 [Streptomyces thioluteus]|uniref:Uncharacterized protein n=1 Tax=Streptomyces thioluteus TaxID=66431 RepID=A0ABN3WNM9_STRTU
MSAYLRAQAYRDQLRPVPDSPPPDVPSPPGAPEITPVPPAPATATAPAPAPTSPFGRFLLRLRPSAARRAGDAGPCAPPPA